MSQADELLNSLDENGISLQLANPDTEPHIVIGDDRFITVPTELQRIAVQFDHDVETVTFDCPRYWDDLDMSQLAIYINYMRKDRVMGCYKATNVVVDESDSRLMHFDWTISRNVSQVEGQLKFLVCIKKADEDGNEANHWNSELNTDMYISEGLETGETVISSYPDIISQWEDEVNEVKQILLDARDAGEFQGEAGYSPKILVREIDGGNELIITDVSGSKTVQVMDGADGTNGYSPTILIRDIDGGHELVITDYQGSKTVKVMDGTDGADGTNGYSPAVLVRDVSGGHELVITDYQGSKTVSVMDGTDGSDGVSPTVAVTTITGGHRVTITDKDGPKTFDVLDGANTTSTGAAGVSPTVAVTEITGGHRVTITDVDGANTFDVMDGETGPAGADGVSPTVTTSVYKATKTVNGTTQFVVLGTTVKITDANGTKSFNVLNGDDGDDGVSPTIAVTAISGGHRVTVTDANGTETFDVMDGTSGSSSGGTTMTIGTTEPTSGPALWFDTSAV